MEQRTFFTENLSSDLAVALSECGHDKIFVLTDSTTKEKCWPHLQNFFCLKHASLITIQATDIHKNINTVIDVWKALSEGKATRHSCLINVGGGMVTDLGGFAASTFKRGIDFINIPTTLLAMVDASSGGKTGFNFNGLKNEIGVFNEPKYVLIDTKFTSTLNSENMLSGYAEMLKHGLLSNDKMWSELISFNICNPNLHHLLRMIEESVGVKNRFVEQDPKEKNIRKALNFGHTFGHAIEAMSMLQKRPIPHGYAVAYGIVCELYLSTVKRGFPTDKMRQTISFIKENYGSIAFDCNDYELLTELMQHDKKNMSSNINVTLLEDVGQIRIDQSVSTDEIKEVLDFYREG